MALLDRPFSQQFFDDLERSKVKVVNRPVMVIGMWEYKPVQITGVLVMYLVYIVLQQIFLCLLLKLTYKTK